MNCSDTCSSRGSIKDAWNGQQKRDIPTETLSEVSNEELARAWLEDLDKETGNSHVANGMDQSWTEVHNELISK